MKKYSIIISITALVGMLTALIGLFTIATNNEQIALLTYLFITFCAIGTIVMCNYQHIDKLMKK